MNPASPSLVILPASSRLIVTHAMRSVRYDDKIGGCSGPSVCPLFGVRPRGWQRTDEHGSNASSSMIHWLSFLLENTSCATALPCGEGQAGHGSMGCLLYRCELYVFFLEDRYRNNTQTTSSWKRRGTSTEMKMTTPPAASCCFLRVTTAEEGQSTWVLPLYPVYFYGHVQCLRARSFVLTA